MREVVPVTLAAALVAGVCVLGGWLAGGDPLVIPETVIVLIVGAWAARLAHGVWRHRTGGPRIPADGPTLSVDGIQCRVVPGLGPRAFVGGLVRPQIYLGDALFDGLDAGEISAVVLHEDHHRRTRAPLRAVSIEAWMWVAGGIGVVRGALGRRLGDLESAADADAIARGASAAALASALLKVMPIPGHGTTSFATSAEDRVAHLLRIADGGPAAPRAWPLEWLPPAMLLAFLVGCHAFAAIGVG